MKRTVLGFFTALMAVAFISCTNPVAPAPTNPVTPSSTAQPVTFSSVTQVGGVTNSVSTSSLTLTFSVDPTSLAVGDITVTGATKGALTGKGTTRTLAISGITVADGATVSVKVASPTGFAITGSPQTAVVYKAAISTDQPVTFLGVTQNGGTHGYFNTSSLTLTFSVDPTSLTASNITITGATKGALTGNGTTRTLAISDITVADEQTVSVAVASPTGFAIMGSPQTAVVYKAIGSAGLAYTAINNNTEYSVSKGTENSGYTIIPESYDGKKVTSIGTGAFKNDTGLYAVCIPTSVTSIGNSAFAGCTKLNRVILPSSVTSIASSAFADCTNLTSVTLSSSVTSIADTVFADCTKLNSVIIPNSVISIGVSAFSGCTNLTSVTIPTSVISIGNRAFSYCAGLTSVTIPSSVISLGTGAFDGCTNLTSVTIPSSVTSIANAAFADCTNLTSVTIPTSVTTIADRTFSGCTSLKNVTIPASVTSIGKSAFSECKGLTSIAIPPSVISIGRGAFSYTGLRGVSIPSGVKSIEDDTFYMCTELTSVKLPTSLKSIGRLAFYKCTNLCRVIIPINVASIGDRAFSDCAQLKSMVVEPQTPPLCTSDSIPSPIEFISVPSLSVDAYKGAEGWSDYAGKIYSIQTN